MSKIIPVEQIENKIYTIRNQKVMLDRDLAEMYGVETRVLVQAVKRNIKRFPEDFMFQLTKEELDDWKSQIVISNSVKMGLRKLPYAFTENGVAMLSSVLNSDKAIQVNIQIMRAFNYLKKRYLEEEDIKKNIEILARNIELLAQKEQQDVTFIFMELDRLNQLIESKVNKKQIGFRTGD